MNTTIPVPDHLLIEEVRVAIEALSDADWLRLDKTAQYFSRNRRMESDDLIQTALVRALDGTRHCPRHVNFIFFLAETMHSIASDDVKAQKRKPELRLVPKVGEDGMEEFDFPDLTPNAETILSAEQTFALVIKEILMLFEDDVVAQTIIEGELEDMQAEELRELTGLTQKAYASKRRLIRRRVDRAFPKGWKQ